MGSFLPWCMFSMRAEWVLGVLCACILAAIVQADETESARGYTWITTHTDAGGIGAIHPGWRDAEVDSDEPKPTLLVKTITLPGQEAVAGHVFSLISTFQELAAARENGEEGASNIMQVYATFYDMVSSPARLIQAIEMAPGKDLSKIAVAELSNDQRTLVARGLFSGLAFLHSRDLAHQDIKRHNVMFGADSQKVTIVDLDLLDRIGKKAAEEVSVYYISPERSHVFLEEFDDTAPEKLFKVTASDDVWAGSLVVLSLFCGEEHRSLAKLNLYNPYYWMCSNNEEKRPSLSFDAFVTKYYRTRCTTNLQSSELGVVVIPEVFQVALRAGLVCEAAARRSAGELAEMLRTA